MKHFQGNSSSHDNICPQATYWTSPLGLCPHNTKLVLPLAVLFVLHTSPSNHKSPEVLYLLLWVFLLWNDGTLYQSPLKYYRYSSVDKKVIVSNFLSSETKIPIAQLVKIINTGEYLQALLRFQSLSFQYYTLITNTMSNKMFPRCSNTFWSVEKLSSQRKRGSHSSFHDRSIILLVYTVDSIPS